MKRFYLLAATDAMKENGSMTTNVDTMQALLDERRVRIEQLEAENARLRAELEAEQAQ